MKRDDTVWIRDPAQLEALSSPVRQNILDRIEARGPCSVKDLATSLDMAPDALYYHVKTLLRVGLLVESGTRKSKRRDEALYDLCARRWHIAYDTEDPENAAALGKVTAGILRQAERDFRLGLTHPAATVRGSFRNLWSLRLESHLTRAELREVNEHFEKILAILRKPKRGGGGQLCAVSWVIAPIDEHRRRREKTSKKRRAATDPNKGADTT